MSTDENDTVNASKSDSLCRMGTRLIIFGAVLLAIGGLFFVLALIAISGETEGDDYVIIMPQVSMMIIGAALALSGLYYRHGHYK